MINLGIITTMSKHDQETQRILVAQNRDALDTLKLNAGTIKNVVPKTPQETQRITGNDQQSALPVTLSPQELRALPFGTIKLDTQGKVLRYNPFATSQGPTPDSIQGKNFFYEVIPLDAIASFASRYQNAVKTKELYAEFKFHITCEGSKPLDVQITMYYSKNSDSFWALLNKTTSDSR
jgi:photoactive yellow protein